MLELRSLFAKLVDVVYLRLHAGGTNRVMSITDASQGAGQGSFSPHTLRIQYGGGFFPHDPSTGDQF